MARIVVLGGGESGCGSAVLAKVKGFDVFLSDRGRSPRNTGDNSKSGACRMKRDAIPKS